MKDYIKKYTLELIMLCAALLLLSGCTGKNVSFGIPEQLELGERYLAEQYYEQAIVVFSRVIAADPKNVEAHRHIAEAYYETGNMEGAADAILNVMVYGEAEEAEEKRLLDIISGLEDNADVSVKAQIAYTETGDDTFLPVLFRAKGRMHDYEGISRVMADVDMLGGMREVYLDDMIQDLFVTEDMEGLKGIADHFDETGEFPAIALMMRMLADYSLSGQDGIIEILEAYYAAGEELPLIGPDAEIYIGGYDENGLRSGFGICFYGENVKPTSRIYVGNWENDLRNGEGSAYLRADYRIRCGWEDDYPEGGVTILQGTTDVIGELGLGHVTSPMNLYDDGEWIAVHCTPDESKSSGYSFQTADMDTPGTCAHVKKHSYCWDCQVKEKEEAGAE